MCSLCKSTPPNPFPSSLLPSLPSPPPNTTTQHPHPCLSPPPASHSCLQMPPVFVLPQCRRKSPGPRRPLGPASSQILLPDILITPPPPRPQTHGRTRHRYGAMLGPDAAGHRGRFGEIKLLSSASPLRNGISCDETGNLHSASKIMT